MWGIHREVRYRQDLSLQSDRGSDLSARELKVAELEVSEQLASHRHSSTSEKSVHTQAVCGMFQSATSHLAPMSAAKRPASALRCRRDQNCGEFEQKAFLQIEYSYDSDCNAAVVEGMCPSLSAIGESQSWRRRSHHDGEAPTIGDSQLSKGGRLGPTGSSATLFQMSPDALVTATSNEQRKPCPESIYKDLVPNTQRYNPSHLAVGKIANELNSYANNESFMSHNLSPTGLLLEQLNQGIANSQSASKAARALHVSLISRVNTTPTGALDQDRRGRPGDNLCPGLGPTENNNHSSNCTTLGHCGSILGVAVHDNQGNSGGLPESEEGEEENDQIPRETPKETLPHDHRGLRVTSMVNIRGPIQMGAVVNLIIPSLGSPYQPQHPYMDHWSAESLQEANCLVTAGSHVPGSQRNFLPVIEDSLVFSMGRSWGFTSYAICLGSSYFQRLLASVPSLQWAAKQQSSFSSYFPDHTYEPKLPAMTGNFTLSDVDVTLYSILFTCVYLATKLVDRVPVGGMLTFILSKLYKVRLTTQQVFEVEAKCLEELSWKLGPFYQNSDAT